MKVYSGVIKLLGNSVTTTKKSGESRTKYSVVDIGEHHLIKVSAPDYLDSYLRVGEKVDLLMFEPNDSHGSAIKAVRTADGKLYKETGGKAQLIGLFFIFTIISFTPIFPLGLWGIWNCIKENKSLKELNALQ